MKKELELEFELNNPPRPAIVPSGMGGDEADDYPWTADDF